MNMAFWSTLEGQGVIGATIIALLLLGMWLWTRKQDRLDYDDIDSQVPDLAPPNLSIVDCHPWPLDIAVVAKEVVKTTEQALVAPAASAALPFPETDPNQPSPNYSIGAHQAKPWPESDPIIAHPFPESPVDQLPAAQREEAREAELQRMADGGDVLPFVDAVPATHVTEPEEPADAIGHAALPFPTGETQVQVAEQVIEYGPAAEAKIALLQDQLSELMCDVNELRTRKDYAYEERNRVVAALATCYPSWKCKTAIEGWDAEWHNCVYIQLPTGQVSWHYHDKHAKFFKHVKKQTKGFEPQVYDGHSTETKYRRLSRFTRDYELQ